MCLYCSSQKKTRKKNKFIFLRVNEYLFLHVKNKITIIIMYTFIALYTQNKNVN